jgi:hypothetical protein
MPGVKERERERERGRERWGEKGVGEEEGEKGERRETGNTARFLSAVLPPSPLGWRRSYPLTTRVALHARDASLKLLERIKI